MKIFKKIINVAFALVFSCICCLVYAEEVKTYISAPDTRNIGEYYTAQRKDFKRVYVEEKDLETNQKIKGFLIECIGYDRYLVGDDNSDGIQELMYEIQLESPGKYTVTSFMIEEFSKPILNFKSDSSASFWSVRALDDAGKKCLPTSDVYIEKTLYPQQTLYKIKSMTEDFDGKDKKQGEVYNCVIRDDKPDEFTDIISFCAVFLFK